MSTSCLSGHPHNQQHLEPTLTTQLQSQLIFNLDQDQHQYNGGPITHQTTLLVHTTFSTFAQLLKKTTDSASTQHLDPTEKTKINTSECKQLAFSMNISGVLQTLAPQITTDTPMGLTKWLVVVTIRADWPLTYTSMSTTLGAVANHGKPTPLRLVTCILQVAASNSMIIVSDAKTTGTDREWSTSYRIHNDRQQFL